MRAEHVSVERANKNVLIRIRQSGPIGGLPPVKGLSDLAHLGGHAEIADAHLAQAPVHVGTEPVEKGLAQAKENGLLAGFPVIDFKATLIDGDYHDVDSSVLAFEIAARAAFRELREKAKPKLLEPIMKVEVVTPEDYTGSVIGDLNARRGQIQSQDVRGNANVITAMVPLANMFGYVNQLRGMSQGRAQFTMQYDHYEPVPQAVADEVVKKYSA